MPVDSSHGNNSQFSVVRFLTLIVKILFSTVKWAVIGVICLEILSFTAITISNYIMYGHAREGSRAVYDPYTLFLQSGGIRPTANNTKSEDKSKNRIIWMFGGSTMRGSTDFDDRTISSLLSAQMNTNDAGLSFTVINFGMNSFNSLLESKFLEKALIENSVHPDLIIFYDGANDSKYFAEHRHPYGHHGYRRVKALVESYYSGWTGLLKPLNAAVYSSFTKELYDKIHQVVIPLNDGDPLVTDLVNLTEQRYEFINRLAKCFGADFVLFWQPMIWVESCPDLTTAVKDKEKGFFTDSEKRSAIRTNFGIPYSAIEKRLGNKPYFVKYRNILCRRQEAAYKPDGVHLTDEGRKIVAAEMASVIKQRSGIMPARVESGGN